MKFRLVFDCDNAAFDDDVGEEIARILRGLEQEYDNRGIERKLIPVRDSNGNTIGTAQITGRLAGRR